MESPDQNYPVNHFEHRIISTGDYGHAPKKRELFVPDQQARAWHDNVLNFFYTTNFLDTSHLPDNAWVNGAMPGSQLIDGVLPHKDNWTFYKLDIKNAFPSVNIATLRLNMVERLHQMPAGRQYSGYLQTFMDEYMVPPGAKGLALGPPASPYLFNFYALPMDEHLSEMCHDYGLTYTRYLDDITISSPKKDRTLGEDTRRYIRQFIEQTPGMKINHAKSRLLGRARHHIGITGVALYPDGRIQPQPQTIDKVFKTFDAIESQVIQGAVDASIQITPTHLGIVDGYHGTLVSMATEPYNETMRHAFSRYRVVRRLVLAALAQQQEPADYHTRHAPSADKIAQVEHMLMSALNGGTDDINTLAHMYPGVWRAMLEKNMINRKLPPQIKSIPAPDMLAPAEPGMIF